MGKLISKRLLIVILTGICDMLIATGAIDENLKALILELLTGLSGVYVVSQSIIEGIKAKKENV